MKRSFLPPFAGLKRTRWQAGLLAYGIIRPTRHAFPFDVNSGLRVAFVTDYSCEGSGGFAPRFPSTCGVPGCQCGLTEALICFRNKAFRASIVMTWNLTFFHLCTNVLKHKRAEFNAEYPVRYAGIHKKAKAPVIAKIEDFSSDLKESEMIEQFNALDRQIGRRNSSADPSTTVITYLQAEEFIHDLIENVVLTIKI